MGIDPPESAPTPIRGDTRHHQRRLSGRMANSSSAHPPRRTRNPRGKMSVSPRNGLTPALARPPRSRSSRSAVRGPPAAPGRPPPSSRQSRRRRTPLTSPHSACIRLLGHVVHLHGRKVPRHVSVTWVKPIPAPERLIETPRIEMQRTQWPQATAAGRTLPRPSGKSSLSTYIRRTQQRAI